MIVYKLVSENLTQLGGRMGTERTSTNFTKIFSTVDGAKKYAEKDYGNKIEWKDRKEYITSGDLRYVMYEIRKEVVIDI